MAQYEVLHAYRSSRDGQRFGPWKPGDVVELTEPDAEWVIRDSPGSLKPMLPRAAEGEARQRPPAADRQHRGGRNRSGS